MTAHLRVLSVLLFCAGLFCLAQAQVPMTGAGKGAPGGGGGGCSPGTNAAAFIARSSGGINTSAYCKLINNLDTHTGGNFTTAFDAVYTFATDSSADALLSLPSATFNGTANGAPAFSANNGFTGVDASATVFIGTAFNPSTATTPNFTQNSGHVSMWSCTNAASGASGGAAIGLILGGSTTRIFPKYQDGNFYSDLNSAATSAGTANASSTGQYLVNRSGASAVQHYKNAINLGSTTEASAAVANSSMAILAQNAATVISFGGGYQLSIATIGRSLSATEVTNTNADFSAFLTAIGSPCPLS